jgi:hypothetical protein
MTCANCGAPIAPGMRYCERCGTPVAAPPAPMPASQWGMQPTGGFVPAGMLPTYAGSDPLLSFDVDYPESLSRWKIFVKWLLIIPHWIVYGFLGFVAYFVLFIAWFAILITGQYPRGLWDFMMLYLRWGANITAYALSLQRDEYPPFGDAPYPVRLNMEYPSNLSRLLIFVKWLLIIPHLFVWAFLGIAWMVAIVIAWFAILITGRYPEGLFAFVTGSMRWLYRITAYTYLMTDKYPPFSLD